MNSVSRMYLNNRKLRLVLLLSLFLIMLSAGVFFYLQNDNMIVGGNIALVKLLWLATVIFCWYVMPILLLLDSRLSKLEVKICYLLLVNMLLRAIVELFMMYVSKNWDPIYGISHDVASLLLLIIIMVNYRRPKGAKYESSQLTFFLMAYILILVFESVFASYILSLQRPDEIIYYVPKLAEHQAILQLTWLGFAICNLSLAVFIKKWIYGKSV